MSNIEAVCIVSTLKMYLVDCLYQMHAVGLWGLVYIIPQLHHLDRIMQERAVFKFSVTWRGIQMSIGRG